MADDRKQIWQHLMGRTYGPGGNRDPIGIRTTARIAKEHLKSLTGFLANRTVLEGPIGPIFGERRERLTQIVGMTEDPDLALAYLKERLGDKRMRSYKALAALIKADDRVIDRFLDDLEKAFAPGTSIAPDGTKRVQKRSGRGILIAIDTTAYRIAQEHGEV